MIDSDKKYDKFIKDIAVIGITQWGVKLRTFLILPLFTKTLGAESYGMWIQVVAALGLASIFCGIGSFAFVRFFAAETNKQKISHGFFSILLFILTLSSIFAFIIYSSSSILARDFFGGYESENIVKLIAVILPFFVINNFAFFFLRTFRKMTRYGLIQIIQNYSELLMIVLLIHLYDDIYHVLIATLITYILFAAYIFWTIFKNIGFELPNSSDILKLKEFIGFDLPNVPVNLGSWMTITIDRYVISAFLGIAKTGIYSASYNFASMNGLLFTPLNFVLVPTLCQAYDENQISKVRTIMTFSMKYYLMLAIPSFAYMSFYAKNLLQIATTAEIANFGAYIIPILSMAMLLQGLQGLIAQILILVKKTNINGIIWIGIAVINLSFNIILVPKLGIIGSAITSLLSFLLATIITSLACEKYLEFNMDWRSASKCILATIIMLAFLNLFNWVGLLGILLSIVLGFIIYIVSIFLLDFFTKREISIFKALILSSKGLVLK